MLAIERAGGAHQAWIGAGIMMVWEGAVRLEATVGARTTSALSVGMLRR